MIYRMSAGQCVMSCPKHYRVTDKLFHAIMVHLIMNLHNSQTFQAPKSVKKKWEETERMLVSRIHFNPEVNSQPKQMCPISKTVVTHSNYYKFLIFLFSGVKVQIWYISLSPHPRVNKFWQLNTSIRCSINCS